MDQICHYSSPVGMITLAAEGNALKGLWFDGQRYDRSTLSASFEEQDLPVFQETFRWLDLYFAGKCPDFMPDIMLCGTAYRKEIWDILKDIPYGRTVTYKDVAEQYFRRHGRKTSPRAAGNAVSHNPVSLIIPCHRVVGSDHGLTGYAGGLSRKQYLLDLEQARIR